MNWDDEPMFEIVDEPRERTCHQDNPKFEVYDVYTVDHTDPDAPQML